MSKNIDFSYKIIQSLSQTEKRYFKIYLKAFSEKSNKATLSLFILMEKTKPFNEALIKSAFFKLYPEKNYSLQKKSLKKILERSLSNYHKEKNIESKINELLHLSTIYASKQLYEIQKVTLLKAKKIAEESGATVYTLKIKTLLNQLLSFHNVQHPTKKMFNEFSDIAKELNQTNNKLSSYTLYLTLFNSVFFTARQFSNKSIAELKSQFEKIDNFNLLFLTGNHCFIESEFLKFYAQNIYFFQIADLENSHIARLKSYHLINDNFNYKKNHRKNFYNATNALIISYVWRKNVKEATLLINQLQLEIKNISSNNEEEKLYLNTLYNEKMLLLLMIEQTKEHRKYIINQSLHFFYQHKNKLDGFNKTLLEFRFSACYFQEKKYKKCLTFIQDISYYEKHPLLSDVIIFSKIIELIAHFELKNEELLQSYSSSICRTRKLKTNSIDDLLLSFATYFKRRTNKDYHLKRLLMLYTKLPLFDYYNSSFLDLKSWLDEKIIQNKL